MFTGTSSGNYTLFNEVEKDTDSCIMLPERKNNNDNDNSSDVLNEYTNDGMHFNDYTYINDDSHHSHNHSDDYSSVISSMINITEIIPKKNKEYISDRNISTSVPSISNITEKHSNIGQSPIKSVVFNMLNSIIGAGIVGLPYIYNTAGLFGGLLLMFIFASLSTYTLRLLIICAKIANVRNYDSLCEYAFGIYGYMTVNICMFIFDFGAITSYLIILGDSVSEIIKVWNYNSLFDRQIIVFLYGICIILPVCLPRTISKIEKLSAFSVFTVIVINGVIFYEWFQYRLLFKNGEYTETIPKDIQYFQMSGMSEALGIVAFAFVCHDISFLFYNTLKNATVHRWTLLSIVGCFGSVIISILFSVPGYLTFGNDIKDNILNNYEINDGVIIFARMMYTVTMSLTYPTCFFVVRHVLYSIFHHKNNVVGDDGQTTTLMNCSLKKHLLFTLPVFFCNLVIGLFVSNLGLVMSVSGSLAAVNLAFVLPCACYLKIGIEYKLCFWKNKDHIWESFVAIAPPFLLLFCGICIAIFSTTFTLYSALYLKNS